MLKPNQLLLDAAHQTEPIYNLATSINPPVGSLPNAVQLAYTTLPAGVSMHVAGLLMNRSAQAAQDHGLAPGASGQPNGVLAAQRLAEALLYVLGTPAADLPQLTPLVNLIVASLGTP